MTTTCTFLLALLLGGSGTPTQVMPPAVPPTAGQVDRSIQIESAPPRLLAWQRVGSPLHEA